MANRVAIVTGANKGIGFGIVKNLCKSFDGVVYLTARNVDRGHAAVKQLKDMGLHPEFHQLDIEDPKSITECLNFFQKTYGGLDLLVNNAGIAYKINSTSPFAEQAEVTLKVNFFSLINVCSAFFPLLRPHARVVNLSSSCGFLKVIPQTSLRNKLANPNLQLSELVDLMNDFVRWIYLFQIDSIAPFAEQAEVTLKVNFFSLINVCSAFFQLLRPHARVVNLSSSAGFLGRIPGESLRNKLANPNLEFSELVDLMNDFVRSAKEGTHIEKGWGDSAYCVSKVGVSALTRIQHRKFLNDPRKDIVINHVHPGYVNTDMSSHKGPLTIEQGADAPTYLALLPKGTTKPRGDYVWFNREIVDWVNGPLPPKF